MRKRKKTAWLLAMLVVGTILFFRKRSDTGWVPIHEETLRSAVYRTESGNEFTLHRWEVERSETFQLPAGLPERLRERLLPEEYEHRPLDQQTGVYSGGGMTFFYTMTAPESYKILESPPRGY